MELVNPGVGLIFWMTLSFGIVLFLLSKFVWPMILGSLKEREEGITNSLEAAKQAREEIQNLQSNNEQLLKEARDEREELIREAGRLKDDLINSAKVEADVEAKQIIDSAKAVIEQEKSAALSELKNKVADLSIEIAEKLLRAELSVDKKQKGLMDKLISDADNQLN
ncbi:MAG: F0F1 ATP synthase subunit B [Bacteroidales bacterium]|jgi:F-type H+-transporting ATPase subunit b|nr:F0F1 ATP synthase subunit B [Bacteroidales bacterium]